MQLCGIGILYFFGVARKGVWRNNISFFSNQFGESEMDVVRVGSGQKVNGDDEFRPGREYKYNSRGPEGGGVESI